MSRIIEKSLNRAYDHSLRHDTGFITAYRGDNTRKENKLKNKALAAILQSKGYGITKVKGSYIENYKREDAREVSEDTFMVVDIKDNGNLRDNLIKIGEKFAQDSILFVHKGGKISELIGTNKNGYPGYKKSVQMKNAIYGKSGEFMTRVNGRPFVFKEGIGELSKAVNIMGQFGNYIIANEILDKLNKRK